MKSSLQALEILRFQVAFVGQSEEFAWNKKEQRLIQ